MPRLSAVGIPRLKTGEDVKMDAVRICREMSRK